MNELLNHKFFSIYSGELITEAPVLNEDFKEIESVVIWDPNEKPEAWNYLIDVGTAFDNLSETVDELQLTITLIKNIKQYEANTKAEGSDILKYLVKNWIIRFVAAYEVSLCLLNAVLDLGYMNRSITRGNFENNKHINKNMNIEPIRKNMENLVKQKLTNSGNKEVDSIGNKIKHEGAFSYDSINELSWNELMHNWGDYQSKDDFEINRVTIITHLINDFHERNLKMFALIVELLDYLTNIFSIRITELKKWKNIIYLQ